MIKRIAVAISLAIVPGAFAETYIVPDGDCGAVTLHLTRGSSFPKLGAPIDENAVEVAYVHPQKKQRITVTPAAGAIKVDVPQDEVVIMAAADLKPVVSGNETRSEHAKALLFCGPKTPRADWQRTAGNGLEIYPQGWNGPRPQLKAGDPMRFIAVDKASNKLIGDLPMKLYGAGGQLIAEGVPAEYSGMNFPYQQPGRYMVTTTYRRPDPKQPDHWLVDTSSLTFDIK